MLPFNQKCKWSDVGFEPTSPWTQVIQSNALDPSATVTCKMPKYLSFVITSYVFKLIFLDWIFGLGENLLFSCRKKFPVCPLSCRKWQIQPGNFRLPVAYVEPCLGVMVTSLLLLDSIFSLFVFCSVLFISVFISIDISFISTSVSILCRVRPYSVLQDWRQRSCLV